MRDFGRSVLTATRVCNEPLLVYGNLPFPILFVDEKAKKKTRLPRWDKLSQWMKLQIIILAFQEWDKRFLTFTIHLHREKGNELLADGRDIRVTIRDRIRKHLEKALGRKVAYFFVIEGWNKATGSPANIHIHGGVWLEDPAHEAVALRAFEKGMAQGVSGYEKEKRAAKPRWFYGNGANWGNYITKLTHQRDPRLGANRVTISNGATRAGKAMWDIISGRIKGVPLADLKAEQGIDQE